MLFITLLGVVTASELVSGRPVSDLLRGTSGSGTTVFGASSSHPSTATTPAPQPAVTVTQTVVPKVVTTTPTVTQTAPGGHGYPDADAHWQQRPTHADADAARFVDTGRRHPDSRTLVAMCGIVGYVGHRQALDVVVEGLRRLEYRGYDSAGVAIVDSDAGPGAQLQVAKKAGRIENLDKELSERTLSGTTGMGHTRWATHGPPNDRNAHPHLDATSRIGVVHNGIIENFGELRAELERAGVELRSDTDTETVAHLVAAAVRDGANLREAVRTVVNRLDGAFTLVFLDAEHPDAVVAARRNSPLVVGVGDGETFLGSDVAAFIEYTRDAVELGQDQIVEIGRDGFTHHRLRRPAGDRPPVPHRLGPRRRREGRLRLLHAQGDRGAARRGARHAARSPRRRSHRARRAAARSPGTA